MHSVGEAGRALAAGRGLEVAWERINSEEERHTREEAAGNPGEARNLEGVADNHRAAASDWLELASRSWAKEASEVGDWPAAVHPRTSSRGSQGRSFRIGASFDFDYCPFL